MQAGRADLYHQREELALPRRAARRKIRWTYNEVAKLFGHFEMDVEFGPKSRRYLIEAGLKISVSRPSWSLTWTAIHRTSPISLSPGRISMRARWRPTRRRSGVRRKVPAGLRGPHFRCAPPQGLCRLADLGRIGATAAMNAEMSPHRASACAPFERNSYWSSAAPSVRPPAERGPRALERSKAVARCHIGSR